MNIYRITYEYVKRGIAPRNPNPIRSYNKLKIETNIEPAIKRLYKDITYNTINMIYYASSSNRVICFNF